MTRPIVSQKTSSAETKGRLSKSFRIGRLCSASVIVCYEDWYEPYDHNPISRHEMSEFIKTETKMLEAKFHSQIELIKAKCLSESDIIKLIKSNIGSCKIGSHTVAIWTFPFHRNSMKKNDNFPNLILAQ